MRDLIVNFVIAGLGIALGLVGVACWWLNDRTHDHTDRALRRRFDQPGDTKETTTDGR